MQAADKRGDYEKISFSANCCNNGFSAFRLPFRPDRGRRAETGCLYSGRKVRYPGGTFPDHGRKKEKEFQLSYETGEDLYLAKGYGRQMSGGYSIQVEELGESGNGLFFVTRLLGPEDLKEAGVPSYPCIVIKTSRQKKPVTFTEGSGR